MENLIKALQIFLKYNSKETSPTNCEHDIFCVMGITEEEISEEDKNELDKLTFHWNDEYDCWASFHYGSA